MQAVLSIGTQLNIHLATHSPIWAGQKKKVRWRKLLNQGKGREITYRLLLQKKCSYFGENEFNLLTIKIYPGCENQRQALNQDLSSPNRADPRLFFTEATSAEPTDSTWAHAQGKQAFTTKWSGSCKQPCRKINSLRAAGGRSISAVGWWGAEL